MNRYLYFTVFVSGMTTLALEFAASRLLGSTFGTSNLVWACIIGLILIYLTAGYFIGGSWADRSPHKKTMYGILAWGAFTSGIVPFVARPVLRLAADAFDQLQVGVLLGSFTAVLVLFIVPITLLGTISPFAIRLAIRDSRQAGRVSGQIYAISTLGSFIGTFLPVLVLIPLVGTTLTILIFSGVLLLVALVGLWSAIGWKKTLPWLLMPLVLVLLTALWAAGPIKQTDGQVYEAESAYNYIQVLEKDGYRYLRLNEGQGIHSVWHAERLDYGGPWEMFLAAPFYNAAPYLTEQVESIAIVGLAAGTVARQASAVFGPIPIDGFEIDPDIIQVGRDYFDMDMPNLNAVAQDGRWGLEHSTRRYTIIGVDAYRPPYIPWHLTTQEFFQVAYDHLDEDGVLVINVGRSPANRTLIDDLASTIQTVFPSVHVVDVPASFNTIVYATVQPSTAANMQTNLLELATRELGNPGSVHPLLLRSLQVAYGNARPTPTVGVVYTDDWAPIEWVTNNMVLNYVFFGDEEVLH
ncbi:MAG TPA: fused MFS/spermidine synthase [Anaerolineales bacterium]|nr:fused MFS/spermidine synthase [Anaerolineales bacterium]